VKLLVATSNAGKLAEIREILAGVALELLSLRDVRLPPPDETGATFHDNAAQKSTICARQSGLLQALRGIPEGKRTAYFFCAVALSPPEGERVLRAEGQVDGSIAFEERGPNGFGYDPIFLPAEAPGKTLAELDSAEKNRLSHRGRALARLRPVLERLARDGAV
jgi:XTP/dITP diphosphohydrolase